MQRTHAKGWGEEEEGQSQRSGLDFVESIARQLLAVAYTRKGRCVFV